MVAEKEEFPLVSIIITTYRRENELGRALCSACIQKYKNIEIILVDDNADSKWNEKVNSIVDKVIHLYKKDIILISNNKNVGSAKSRNIGIKAASGYYVTFLDDDDIYLEEKVSFQVEEMLKSDADFSVTDMLLYDDRERLKEKRIRNDFNVQSQIDLYKYHIMHHLTGNDTFMFRTEFIKKIGGYRAIDIGDDYYIIQKAIIKGGKFVYIHKCHVRAYLHKGENGGLSSGQKKIIGEKRLQYNKMKYFYLLNFKEKSYVWMRHFAVISFAEWRRKRYIVFFMYVILAFVCNPYGLVEILLKHL